MLLSALAPSVLLSSALAADFLQVDAAAPGMAVAVTLLREGGGFTGSEVLTSSCGDLVLGPALVADRGANPAAPVTGSVLQFSVGVKASATAGQTCILYVNGTALSAFNSGIDNRFQIVAAATAPTDGGTGDADGAVDGVITLAASRRTDGGTLVFDSLSVPAGSTLVFADDDPISVTAGNEAKLPVFVLVKGAATIEGSVYLAGDDADDASAGQASNGGDGAPGGGGGAVGSNCYGGVFAAGDGFTGGGGTITASGCGTFGFGGVGATTGPDFQHGGEGLFTVTANGSAGYAGGAGGGSGHPWGTGGGGGACCTTAGAGGYGGGGGPGHSEATGWGAGGGGFGSAGENGVGTVGGAATTYNTGGAGLANGSASLIPLAGGSGGGSGDSGSSGADGAGGGGGGGALLLYAASLTLGTAASFDLWGGDGGDTTGANPGSSTGGAGGAGGGLFLAAPALSGLTAGAFDLHGGYGGHEANGYYSGDGGEGRLRVDGATPPTLTNGPTGRAPTTHEGPALLSVSVMGTTTSSATSTTLLITDTTGALIDEVPVLPDGSVVIWPFLPAGGDYLLTLVDDSTGLTGPAAVAWATFTPDFDGDGVWAEIYGGEDCDDADPFTSPDADETCDGIDDNCDGTIDEGSAVDALTWYADDDLDGFGDPASTAAACAEPVGYVADATDCDDTDDDISPGADELCNGIDDDCDGEIDEDSAVDAPTWYPDFDGDGYGDPANGIPSCTEPAGYVSNDEDCNDASTDYQPGILEVCTDPEDYNCDGSVLYQDADSDGAPACEDCNDADSRATPGGVEICDAIDNDCNGTVDDGVTVTVYTDADGDGFGDPATADSACAETPGTATNGDDCDDSRASTYPGAEEIAGDGLDQDCDGEDAEATDPGDGDAGGGDDGIATDTSEPDDDNIAINPLNGTFLGGKGCTGCASTEANPAAWSLAGLLALVWRRRRPEGKR